MTSPISPTEVRFNEMLAAVAPNLTRSDLWSAMIIHVQDVMMADCKTYKEGAFSSLIQLNDSAPRFVSICLKSPLVSQAEKDVFLRAIQCLLKCSSDYRMDKSICVIGEELFKNLIGPLIELFRADMVASAGVYVPRSLVARRLYSIDLYKGTISAKDCKSASQNQRERYLT